MTKGLSCILKPDRDNACERRHVIVIMGTFLQERLFIFATEDTEIKNNQPQVNPIPSEGEGTENDNKGKPV